MAIRCHYTEMKKTLNFTGIDTYVKESYNLSRERVTVYTQVSSDPDLTLKPDFIFKGKGTKTSLHPPDGIKYNWAPKGSYRLEQMLYTITNLPNRYNIFTPKNYAIYVLDDYSVHIMREIKEALLKRGYVLVIIGGRVTGDIQINDTDLHSPLFFSDTDNLMYEIEAENVSNDFSKNKELFDFSKYSAESKYYDYTNALVFGKIKDKMRGAAVEGFVGLKPKCIGF